MFSNDEKLQKLNGIIHPAVKLDFETWRKQHSSFNYIIKESALVFEASLYRELDAIILVHAPETLRIKRVLFRDQHRTI